VIARTMQLRTSDRGGGLPGVAAPIVLDGTRMSAGKSSPRLGEDTGAGWRLR
jgi:hypothetical protein